MPPAIAAALVALVPALGGTIAFGVSAATVIAYGAVTGLSIGLSYGLNKLTAKKAGKPDPQISQFTIKQPLPVRSRAYGRNKLGGALFFEHAIPVTGAELIMGIIHCEGPVDEIENFWLNDTLSIPGAGLGGINNALPWVFYVALESRRGDSSNASINSLLVPYGFTGHLYGLCYTVMQCRQPIQPAKNFQYYYPNGVPAVRVIARCAKYFDPRDVMQSWADPSTWKWGRNTALIAMDYLTIALTDADGVSIPRGMGLPQDSINIASFTAFANLCDEVMTTTYAYDALGNVITSAGTEPRYACDGVYTMEEAPSEVLARILATADATLYTLADGTIGIRGGKWTTPTVTIDDSMILQADLSQGNDKFTAFNQLKISITATNMDYQVVEGSPLDDEDSQDEIGVIAQDLSLPFVHSYSQARRLAKIQMAKGNPRWRYNSLVCNLAALNALGEEFIHVTHSIAGIDEDFMVLGFRLIGGTTCELQLASISSEAFSWVEATEDLPPPSVTGVVGVSIIAPQIPIIVSITFPSSYASVSIPFPVVVTLTPDPSETVPIAYYEVEHRIVGASDWNTTSGDASGGVVVLPGYAVGDMIELRARAVSTGSVPGDWTFVSGAGVGGGAGGGGAVAAFDADMLAWFNSLPTTLPATAGVFWNNGNTLAMS